MEWKRLSIVQRHKSRGIKTWYLREYSSGKISYKSLGTTCRRVAQECLHRLLVLRFSLPGEASAEIPLRKMMDSFLSRANLCDGSREQYARIVGHFVEWCEKNGIQNVLSIDENTGRLYYAGLDGKSAGHRCKVCGCFLNWVYRECRIQRIQPFKFVEYRKYSKMMRDSWSSDEVDRIVGAAPTKELRMLWALMAYAGLRIHEAAKVTDADISGRTLNVLGKGGKMATLPICDKLASEFSRFGRLENGLGIGKQKSIRNLVKVCANLGIQGWVANHKFRHSFATNLAKSGCPVAIAMRLLRHSSSKMTLDVYTHVIPADLHGWLEKL